MHLGVWDGEPCNVHPSVGWRAWTPCMARSLVRAVQTPLPLALPTSHLPRAHVFEVSARPLADTGLADRRARRAWAWHSMGANAAAHLAVSSWDSEQGV
jgi:hypothetical protein